jgi:dTDP-4-dehydrorhamnose reductase
MMTMHASLELWGGIECTHNRVGDLYFDQIEKLGHDRRPQDLEQIAELGIHVLRYPMLWEWAHQHESAQFDWSWPQSRLPLLRSLGIRPIVGLVHHGSGPASTNLLDPHFAPGLARYAQAFAERYPWVSDYTPVNEPLTTARFSGLYGIWYPHAQNDLAFAQALLNQCRAVSLSMAAVRRIHSEARLIQTEDIGVVHSTERLR